MGEDSTSSIKNSAQTAKDCHDHAALKATMQQRVEEMMAESDKPGYVRESLMSLASRRKWWLLALLLRRGWNDAYAGMTSRWTNMALVSALVLTMISFDPLEAVDADDFLSDSRESIAHAYILVMVVAFVCAVGSLLCSTYLLIWASEIVTDVDDLIFFAEGYGKKLWWLLPVISVHAFIIGKMLSLLVLYQATPAMFYFLTGILPFLSFIIYTYICGEKKRKAYRDCSLFLQDTMIAAIQDARFPRPAEHVVFE